MTLIWMLYTIDLLNNISIGLAILWGVALFVALFMIPGLLLTHGDDLRPTIVKILRTALIVFAITLPIDIVIPSKNVMYAMAAVSVGEKLADTSAVQGIAADGLKAVQHWINTQLAEPEKK
jgi:hypothetical protein